MISFKQALQVGIDHHNAGEWEKAEAIYHQLLKFNPKYAPAIHLLGVLAHECQREDMAGPYFTCH